MCSCNLYIAHIIPGPVSPLRLSGAVVVQIIVNKYCSVEKHQQLDFHFASLIWWECSPFLTQESNREVNDESLSLAEDHRRCGQLTKTGTDFIQDVGRHNTLKARKISKGSCEWDWWEKKSSIWHFWGVPKAWEVSSIGSYQSWPLIFASVFFISSKSWKAQ